MSTSTQKRMKIHYSYSPIRAFAAVLATMPLLSSAADYYVSPTGNNANSGSLAAPWRTFAKAASTAVAGDTVYFRGGNYASAQVSITRSGTVASPITFQNFQNETPILNGSGVNLTTSRGLININNGADNVVIQGFDIRNYWSADGDTPAGIWVWGGCQNIELLDNTIHDLGSTASAGIRNAHGIAVYGNASTSTSVTINGNELYDLHLGNSESLVVNGNVNGFSITNNIVRDNDNIGIDCIGFEGVNSNANVDQARNGIVAGNTVTNIDTRSNPSYNSATAGGIYVDGGKDIVIERNFVSNCNYGIEVASENAGRTTDNITVRNNIVENSLLAGFAIGGFSSNTNGSGGGSAANCNIYNNTFYNNDDPADGTSFGQIYLQYRVNNCNFRNNILYTSNVEFGANVFIAQWNTSGSGNQFNHNLFYGIGGDAVFVIQDSWLYTFNMYLSHTSSSISVGTSEAYQNPLFASAASGNFSLNSGSPARNSGNNSVITTGELDYAGDFRIAQNIVDRGALESESSAPGSTLPEIMVTVVGNQLQLTWDTETGFTYTLEVSTDLTGWNTVSGYNSKQGNGSADSYSVATSSTRRFYRLCRTD